MRPNIVATKNLCTYYTIIYAHSFEYSEYEFQNRMLYPHHHHRGHRRRRRTVRQVATRGEKMKDEQQKKSSEMNANRFY